jgi:hypothetical protein
MLKFIKTTAAVLGGLFVLLVVVALIAGPEEGAPPAKAAPKQEEKADSTKLDTKPAPKPAKAEPTPDPDADKRAEAAAIADRIVARMERVQRISKRGEEQANSGDVLGICSTVDSLSRLNKENRNDLRDLNRYADLLPNSEALDKAHSIQEDQDDLVDTLEVATAGVC